MRLHDPKLSDEFLQFISKGDKTNLRLLRKINNDAHSYYELRKELNQIKIDIKDIACCMRAKTLIDQMENTS